MAPQKVHRDPLGAITPMLGAPGLMGGHGKVKYEGMTGDNANCHSNN